jgi:predicted metal-binding protein
MESPKIVPENLDLTLNQSNALISILKAAINANRIHDYYFAHRESLIITPKVRLKCIYGCPNYNVSKKCPPEETLTFEQCKSYLDTYQSCIIVRFKPINNLCPKDAQDFLLEVERQAMLLNMRFALAIFPKHCEQCNSCKKGIPCKDPIRSRGSVSSICIDIMGSLENIGLSQKILQTKDKAQDWYYIGLVLLK